MRGKAEISYTDSRGNEFNLMSDGLRRIKSASFHEYSWNKDVSSKRFGEKLRAFKKDALSLSATIYFDGPDREQHLNEFHDATEYDIVKGEAGTLTWEEYSIKCFVISSKTHPAEERFGAPAANEVVFYCPDPFWTKVQSYSSYTANDRPVKSARIAANKNPIKELTGELVHFDDAKEGSYLPKTELVLEPKQDLHGYDHPWVGGAGKNLFGLGDITVTGQSSRSLVSTTVIPAGTYTISAEVTSTDTTYTTSLIYPKYQSGSWGPEIHLTRGSRASGTVTFTDTVNQLSFYASKNSAASDGKTATFKNIQIEKGSTATAYEPYENICPIEPYDTVELYHNDSYSEHNIWDEEWEVGGLVWATGELANLTDRYRSKNFQKCAPATEYYLRTNNNNVALFFYDGLKNFISYWAPGRTGGVFTSPSNAHYFKVHVGDSTVYNHDICINISDPDFNGQYEPYHNSRPKLDTKPYLVRPASQLGTKAYDKLVGMSVGWNQLAPITTQVMTVGGVTYTPDGKGSVIANGTATAASSYTVSATGSTLITTHKYFVRGCPKNGSANTYYISDGYVKTDSGNGFIGTLNLLRCTLTVANGYTANNLKFTPQIIDLTAALTPQVADYIYSLETTTTGAGVAFFREYFPEIYYDYNPGELIHTAPTAKEVTGKNLFSISDSVLGEYVSSADGSFVRNGSSWRSDYIRVYPGFSYKINGFYNNMYSMIAYYDGHKRYVSRTSGSTRSGYSGIVPEGCQYLCLCQYVIGDNDFRDYRKSILMTSASNDNVYEPYHVTRYPYPNLRLGGIPKIVNGQLTSDGDTLDSDGTLKRKYGLVDLGTLNWGKAPTNFQTASLSNLIKKPENNSYVVKMMTTKPMIMKSTNGVSGTAGTYECYVNSAGTILWYYPLDAYSDGAAFKTAMSGVMLLYELAEPVTEHVQPFVSPQKVDPLGLEIYEDKRPVPIPVCHETRYYDGTMLSFKSSQFGGDVYGLTIDLVSGEIKKTWKEFILSDYIWNYVSSRNFYYSQTISELLARSPVVCNGYKYDLDFTKNGTIEVGYAGFYNKSFIITDTKYGSDYTAFRQGMAGIKAYAKLETPEVIYQLTPRQLKALTGDNYVWGSDGIVSLAYISDFDPHMLTAADGTPITPQEGMIYIIQEGAYKDHEFIWNGEEYLDLTPAINKAYDLSYPYEYDYKADFESYLTLTNDNILGSSYIAVIYGPCTNPDIILANDGDEDDVEIAINTDVPAGGRLVVDMTDKTVTKYMPDGSIINAFGQRDLDAGYLWTKVPYGLSHVIWDGSFDFDLLLIEERSEPKWLLG